MRRLCCSCLLFIHSSVILSSAILTPHAGADSQLNGRPAVFDGEGLLLSWIAPDPAVAYPAMINLSVNFLLHDVPHEQSYPIYYGRSVYERRSPHTGVNHYSNPADVLSGFVRSYIIDYYRFSGDDRLNAQIIRFARYMIAHGSTPASSGWTWPACPYPQDHGGVLPPRASDRDGAIMPHLVGKVGQAYAYLYMFTEEQEFLAAANACATALAQNIRTGTAAQSPWPFRVVPDTGEVYAEMEYCADVIDPISLFDSLIDLGQDSSGAYRAARDSAWTWLVSERGPLATENWGNFFEDMGYQFDNSCQINAGDTALYLLSRRESDPQWRAHVDQIIAYMEVHFGEEQYGAMTMNEQDLFRIPMISHTARYAAALAWRKSFGGGVGDQETAFRSLNWSTYGSCPEKNRVFVEIMDAVFGWFTDCHGDYVQHLLSAMAALPEWAPATRPHLLSSSSVIQQAVYGAGYLRYRCFHTGSTETLRTPSKPAAILADGEILGEVSAGDGWTWTPLAAGGVCRIEHAQSRDILVSWLEPPAVAVELRMPSAVFYPGDNCQLNLTVINANSAPAIGLPLAVVLESAGQYWFYPGWTPGVDSVVIEWPPGCAGYRLIAPFAWPPDAGAGSAQFFAALTAPDFSALASDIARWPFAW